VRERSLEQLPPAGVDLFDVVKALLEIADPLAKAAHFLSDRLDVFQA
jgi:hypothetical protein